METMLHLTNWINQHYKINLDNVKSTFENIVADENRHREIIAELKELIEPKESGFDNTPLMKYQSPDKWIAFTPNDP
jgi:rubrerythrin